MNFTKIIASPQSIIRHNVKLINMPGIYNSYLLNINELRFNPYNKRLAKEIMSFEYTSNTKIGYDTQSQEFIYKLLSSIKHNKFTRKDILNNGLIRNIVVDLQGTIIDGNRRIAILKQLISTATDESIISKFSQIDIIVIPRILSEREINEYETKLQIAEDSKVEYDVINMYLKVDGHLKEVGRQRTKKEYTTIAKLMGSKYTWQTIENMNKTFQEMKLYLAFFPDQSNNYNLLENRHDQFKQLVIFNKYYESKSIKSNYPLTYNNFKKIKDILYIFISLGMRANPNFRDLVPKKTAGKSPLSSDEGLKLVHNWILDNKLNKFVIENPSSSHSVFSSEYLNDYIKKLNFHLNNKDPLLSYEDNIYKIEQKLKNVYEVTKHKSNANNNILISIDNCALYIKQIKKRLNNDT